MTRYSDRIQRVVVRLGDKNGPRGGVDRFCRIQVYLFDAPVAVIEDIGLDMYAVIDRAGSGGPYGCQAPRPVAHRQAW